VGDGCLRFTCSKVCSLFKPALVVCSLVLVDWVMRDLQRVTVYIHYFSDHHLFQLGVLDSDFFNSEVGLCAKLALINVYSFVYL
jgi:hypothetical protein